MNEYELALECWGFLGAKEIVMEQFDIHDQMLPYRLVYRACEDEVFVEDLVDRT